MNSLKTCRFCGKQFSRRLNCSLHENVCDDNPLEIPRSTAVLQTGGGGGGDRFDLSASSLGGAAREYKMYFRDETTEEWLVDLHEAMTKETHDLLNGIRKKEGALFKWYLTLEVTFRKLSNPYVISDPSVYFNTYPLLLYIGDLVEKLQNRMKTLREKIDIYEQNGSGWVLHQLVSITVSVLKVDNPLTRKPLDENDVDDKLSGDESSRNVGDE